MLQRLLWLFKLARIAQGALYQSIDEVPSGKPYDFIIAGGGTAGSVIANRLTENPNFRVLVLEAGPSNEGAIELQVPGLVGSLWRTGSRFDWNYTTVPQIGYNGRTVPYYRGYVLGGTSSTNGMAYTRGSVDDYNRFAAITGDEGWSWYKMFPYMLKNEIFYPPAKDTLTHEYDPKYHNFTGITSVSVSDYPRPLDQVYLQASKELHEEFPYIDDINTGYPLGLGWRQDTVGNGTRSSAATSYLGPQFINRPNLHVVLNTRVTRVLKSCNKHIDLRTVEFVSGAKQTPQTLTANKEIILSLGVIGTPHILLNSGIGDAAELKNVGVKSVLHLPSVGKNFSDSMFFLDTALTWAINMTVTPVNATEALNQWIADRTGPFIHVGGNHMIWKRVQDTSIFSSVHDPAAGPHTPHYELMLDGTPRISPTAVPFMRMIMGVVTPASRGSVSLNSSNPLDAPLIDPSYLKEEIDVQIAKEAFAGGLKFVEAPVFKGLILGPTGTLANVTEDTLEQYIRDMGIQTGHGVGTSSMSAKGAHYGVVDPDLRLKGAKGLRVADASVIPFVTSSHVQAPLYAFAERAADFVKDSWR